MNDFLIAANWKMNGDIELVHEMSESLNRNANINDEKVNVLICPPYPYLQLMNSLIENESISLGGQNLHFEEKGAFTGEISASMLLDLGCEYVIIGHSERRAMFGDTDDLINKKLNSALSSGISPILCIGETLEERKAGTTLSVLDDQLEKDLKGIDIKEDDELVIAYEPIWAIGTGLTPSNEEIKEVHDHLRNYQNNRFPNKKDSIFILYGGSLNDKNCKEILSIENVNGGLIGGASLVAPKFKTIINTAYDISR